MGNAPCDDGSFQLEGSQGVSGHDESRIVFCRLLALLFSTGLLFAI